MNATDRHPTLTLKGYSLINLWSVSTFIATKRFNLFHCKDYFCSLITSTQHEFSKLF